METRIKYLAGYDVAAQVAGLNRDKVYDMRRSHKLVGVRRVNGITNIPIDAFVAIGIDIDETHPEVRTSYGNNLPGMAYYFSSADDAAQACGVNNNTVAFWLWEGRIPGAMQPGGENTTWKIPVDGLWAAGLTPSRRDASVELLYVPADDYFDDKACAPLPPLDATLDEVRESLGRPARKRLKRQSVAAAWTTAWKNRADNDRDLDTIDGAPQLPLIGLSDKPTYTPQPVPADAQTSSQPATTTRHAVTLDKGKGEAADIKQRLRRIVDDMYSTAIDLALNDNPAEAEWVKLYAQKLRPLAE